MFRRKFFMPISLVGIFIIASVTVFAQSTSVGGRVDLKNADGTLVPLDGAKVECYRIDIKSGCVTAKTNKKGEFIILGIPYGAKVVLAVSGEGISPRISQDVAAGNEKVVIEVIAGNGEVLTEDKVREVRESSPVIGPSNSGELSKDQKEALAKAEAERERIEKKNAKSADNNQRRSELLKEGNQAFKSNNWADAIARYDEGFNLDPEFLGGTVFLKNKAKAHLEKAVANYKEAVNTKNGKAIDKAKSEAVKDFTQALLASNRSYTIIKDAPVAEIGEAKAKTEMKDSLAIVKDVFRVMGQMRVNLATGLLTEEDAVVAVSVSKDALKLLPGDPDILAGLAMALYTSSSFKGSVDELKESLSFWNQYKKAAPKDHSQQAVADEMIPFLEGEIK